MVPTPHFRAQQAHLWLFCSTCTLLGRQPTRWRGCCALRPWPVRSQGHSLGWGRPHRTTVSQKAECHLSRLRCRTGWSRRLAFYKKPRGSCYQRQVNSTLFYFLKMVSLPHSKNMYKQNIYKHQEHAIPTREVCFKQLKPVIYLKYKWGCPGHRCKH